MSIDEVIGIWFMGSFVVNLLHFHGDGKFNYVPACFIKWQGKTSVWVIALILMILCIALKVPIDTFLILAFWACGQTYSIWARYRERVLRHEQTQPSNPAAV